MDEYKPNSHKSKSAPEKRVEKVITGSAKPKKKSGIRKFTDIFLSDDVGSVKTYIFQEVLVPAIKEIVLDSVKTLLGVNDRSGKNSSNSRTPYRSYYEKSDGRKEYASNRTKTGYSYDDIILDNRGEAEEVLSRMDDLISTYGLVSVADFYDLVGISGNYTDNKYGWTDIRSASVERARGGGYLIKMPKALPLN